MPMPTHEDAMQPVLRVLSDGQEHHRSELAELVADAFSLSSAERAELLPSGKTPVVRSRTGWALSYLKQAGLVASSRRGWYRITPTGVEALASSPARIDNDFLTRYEGFRDFRARSRSLADAAEDGAPSPGAERFEPEAAPDEALEQAYSRIRAAVEAELLEAVRRSSPSFFEQVVIDLLVQMGYGGNRAEAARAIGRSGDGGIDGVIDEDRLGLDAIYVQAKRWEAAVGRPELQKFAGALQGQRATKGVFITTSGFTTEAREFAERLGIRLVLIDGRRLAALMFEHNVGVSERRSYPVKEVDADYFEEE